MLAIRTSQMFAWLQKKWVNWMQQREARLTMAQKKWSLAIFMLCSCSGCVLIFLAGITPGINSFSAPVAVQPLRMPAIQPNTNANVQTPITREDTLTIRRYLQTIDSMSQTQEGKAQLDAYFRQRPGLSDSIAVLRKIFYHQ